MKALLLLFALALGGYAVHATAQLMERATAVVATATSAAQR